MYGLMHFFMMTMDAFSDAEAGVHFLTYLLFLHDDNDAFSDAEAGVHFLIYLLFLHDDNDVFFNVEAGAHFIHSHYAFRRYKFLQIEFTAQYTETNMTCHFINLNIYFAYSKIQSLNFHD
jgi:hypothetical protein